MRTATADDVPAAIPLLNAAYGLNPDFETRLRRYVATEPGGWVVVEGASAFIGLGGLVSFGRCAYIGLMAVSPDAQRRGIGSAIFEELLKRCDARGHSLLLLDASDSGAPLYERFGFRDHGVARSFTLGPVRVGRTEGAPSSVDVRPIDPCDDRIVAEVSAFDARCYGADRSALVGRCLRERPRRAFTARDPSGDLEGYAIGQARSFGPCMARSTDVARALLRHALALPYPGPVTWLVAGQNEDAVALANELGLPARQWRHMRRGESSALASDWSSLFAKVSLAVG